VCCKRPAGWKNNTTPQLAQLGEIAISWRGHGRLWWRPGEKASVSEKSALKWARCPEGNRIERYRKTPAAPGPDFG